ncbi:hypothetical protein LCGC14_1306600 [marine sediment metagenome]|uniref:Uncharacterized protein n=1 Tax=marine sediment metagenome TaxID=412755 RepID=A0A0F9L8D8_9ZZZZ
MARYWAPLRDPNKPEARSHSISRVGTVGDQWGQRPLFSEPGEDQLPPDQGNIGYEGRLDDIHPSDGRKSADGVADFRVDEAFIPIQFTESIDNVAFPPTDAELTAAFGAQSVGSAFVVRDGGGAGLVYLVIKGGNDTWWYELLTKAV